MTSLALRINDSENTHLQELSYDSKEYFNDIEFRKNGKDIRSDISPFLHDYVKRNINVGPLDHIMVYFMSKNGGLSKSQIPQTDAWLAPRVHACFRLTRREASIKEIWAYLAYRYADYVRWRWPGGKDSSNLARFLGKQLRKDNALSRLWWSAELIRNGNDYSMVKKALSEGYQDIPNTLTGISIFHDKNVAFSATRIATSLKKGPVKGEPEETTLTTRKVNLFSRALRGTTATVPIESIAEPYEFEYDAIKDWIRETPNPQDYEENDPVGPDDRKLDMEDIKALDAFCKKVADKADLLNNE